jgi:carboxylesterase type B
MSLVLNLLVTLLVASATSATPLVVRSGPRPIVSDPSTGVSYQGNLSTDVESFLNIRFAEDTGGSNRFAPPKPYHYPRDAVVNASHYGAACPQAVQSLLFGSITDVSEDCLTLRIDRLHNVTATNLPVMVYIFGGGFTVGQIYETNYDPVGLLRAAADNGSPIIYAGMK